MNDLISFFQQSKLFHDLSDEELRLLLPLARCGVYEKDSYIVREDEKGDELFLIKSGIVEILKKDKEQGDEVRLALLYEEDWFGEMAVLGTKHA